MSRLSVRIRLTIWYAAALTVAMAVLAGAMYAAMRSALEADLDDDLRREASAVAELLRHELGEGELPELAGEDAFFKNAWIQVVDRDGRLVASPPELEGRRLDEGLDLSAVPVDGSGMFRGRIENPRLDEEGVEVAAVAVADPADGREYVAVVVAGRSQLSATLSLARRLAFTLVPVLLALAVVGGWALATQALAPVAAMARQARQMGADRLGDRLEAPNPDDELGRLAAVLNELLDRIQGAFDRMRQFVADASHELRTPVGVIRSGAAVALTPPVTIEECVETLRIIDDQAARLGRLVDDMFTLARADAGDPALLAREPVPLGELIASCAAAAQPLAAAAGVSFEFTEPQEQERFCIGDRVRLEQMVMNLVSNAIRHSGSGGRVRLALDFDDGDAVVAVSDNGPGVPVESRHAIFDRFVRLDPARARETGGGGLGLPIARWVAEAHGGSIAVGEAPGGGAAFVVRLPLDDTPPSEFPANSSASKNRSGTLTETTGNWHPRR